MSKQLVKIDVRIPFRPGGQLGAEYNHIMNETNCDWVLFLDHDLFLCNPHWYLICQTVIAKYGKTAGMFSCRTNHLGKTIQRDGNAPQNDHLGEHIDYATEIFKTHQYQCTECTDKFSGMFFLIKKFAWEKVNGFPGVGIFKEDWDFSRKLLIAGFKLWRIDGLYVYHLRETSRVSRIEGVLTTKEMRDIKMGPLREKRRLAKEVEKGNK
jgi:GT2 family glycosyltransferase